jgi:hypothetical protein
MVLNFVTDEDARSFLDIVDSPPAHPLLSVPPAEHRALDAVRVRVYDMYAGLERDVVARRFLSVSRETLSSKLDISSYIIGTWRSWFDNMALL